MKNWHFNVLFFVGVGGAIFLLLAPWLAPDVGQNPTALTGIAAILGYVLRQKIVQAQHDEEKEKEDKKKKEGDDEPA